MGTGQSTKTITRQRIWSILRFVLAAGLIAYVVSFLSWHDRTLLADGREVTLISVSEEQNQATIRIESKTFVIASDEIVRVEPGLRSLVRGVSAEMALLAVLLALPVPFVCAFRYDFVLRGQGLSIPRSQIMRVVLAGYVFNLALPGSAGADVYRTIALRKSSGSWNRVVTGVAVDRVLGLLALAAWVGVAAAFCLGHPVFAEIAQWTLIVCVVAAVALIGLLATGVHLLAIDWIKAVPWNLRGWQAFLAVLDSLELLLHHRAMMARAIGLSLVSQAFNVASMAAMAYALGIDYPLAVAGLILPTALLITLFAPTPQGLGVLEGALVVVLAPVVSGGANACILLAFGVRLLRLAWAAPGAGVLLRRLL